MNSHGRDIVVIGASAGGVETLTKVAAGLDPEIPASIFVVLHLMRESHSALPAILDRASPLRASQAQHGEPIEQGRIYVAPPDRHLIVGPEAVMLNDGPRENGHRPAIDALFRSAAHTYRERVVGVVLSGLLDDGAAGTHYVKSHGGVAVVQDPDDAIYKPMPTAAIAAANVDEILPAGEIAAALGRLTRQQIVFAAVPNGKPPRPQPGRLSRGESMSGVPTPFTCPDCGGALWEMHEGSVLRFECHVGHVFSTESMIHQHGETVEAAMWSALRMLEERSQLLRKLAGRSSGASMARFEHRADEVERQADGIRDVLVGIDGETARV